MKMGNIYQVCSSNRQSPAAIAFTRIGVSTSLLAAIVGLGISIPSAAHAGWTFGTDNSVYQTEHDNYTYGTDNGYVTASPFVTADQKVGFNGGGVWVSADINIPSGGSQYPYAIGSVYGGGGVTWSGPGSPTSVSVAEHVHLTFTASSSVSASDGTSVGGYADVAFSAGGDTFLAVGESGVETSFDNHAHGYFVLEPEIDYITSLNESHAFNSASNPKTASASLTYTVDFDDEYTPSGSPTSVGASYWAHAESIDYASSSGPSCSLSEFGAVSGQLEFDFTF